jgi:hypothetical protein
MSRSSVWSIVDTAIWSGPLAFAVDAVNLWGLNRLSPLTTEIVKLTTKGRRSILEALGVHDARSIARAASAVPSA